jgi:lipoprotein-releasing system permease protein
MLYGLKIAARYLTASKAQTALLVVGVAVGVFIFIFMSALIGGLAEFILSRTAGDISHVTIEAEATDPALLMALPGRVLLVQEPSTNTPQLREAISYTPLIEALPEVKAVSPQITGAGFLRRGTQVAQVSIIGLEPGRESAISDLAKCACGRARCFWANPLSMIWALRWVRRFRWSRLTASKPR